jgi:hypothetical protein
MMLVLVSCDQKPTLQKYFVKSADSKDFVTLDIGTGFLKNDKMKLTADETKALESMEKLNVLVFKRNDKNAAEFDKQKVIVKDLLKSDKYEELMKMNFGEGGISVNTKGEGEHLDEFVIFLNNRDTGFGVIRVLGDDMTPQNVMTIVGLLQKSDFNSGQLKPVMDLMRPKTKK